MTSALKARQLEGRRGIGAGLSGLDRRQPPRWGQGSTGRMGCLLPCSGAQVAGTTDRKYRRQDRRLAARASGTPAWRSSSAISSIRRRSTCSSGPGARSCTTDAVARPVERDDMSEPRGGSNGHVVVCLPDLPEGRFMGEFPANVEVVLVPPEPGDVPDLARVDFIVPTGRTRQALFDALRA